MINYRLVIKCWGGYHEGGICVLTLNVLVTTDDFMSVDHKAFKTAVWKALDGTKNQLSFTLRSCATFPSSRLVSRLEINFGKYDPLLWHEQYVSTIAKPASKYLHVHSCLGILLKTKRLRPWGRGILHES